MQSSQHSSSKQRRISLSKHRTEIEQWVEQGHSDEWIANALGTSRASVQSFRSRRGILRRGRNSGPRAGPSEGTDEPASVFEGVLDQGEEGYGLWLDPAVADDPLFREGFGGVSDIRVLIEPDRIVLQPASDEGVSLDATIGHSPAESTPTVDTEDSREQAAPTDSGLRLSSSQSVNGREPGRVKFFDAAKGYGFLIRPDGEEIFFHRSEIENGVELEAGEFVVYEPGMSQRGPAAKKVKTAG